MKKYPLLLLAVLCILISVPAVSAFDGTGSDAFCIVDDYGCYVHDENGNSLYLMFWSEYARQLIMGDISAPGTNVVARPPEQNAHLPLLPEGPQPFGGSSKCMSIPEFIEVINSKEGMSEEESRIFYICMEGKSDTFDNVFYCFAEAFGYSLCESYSSYCGVKGDKMVVQSCDDPRVQNCAEFGPELPNGKRCPIW